MHPAESGCDDVGKVTDEVTLIITIYTLCSLEGVPLPYHTDKFRGICTRLDHYTPFWEADWDTYRVCSRPRLYSHTHRFREVSEYSTHYEYWQVYGVVGTGE